MAVSPHSPCQNPRRGTWIHLVMGILAWVGLVSVMVGCKLPPPPQVDTPTTATVALPDAAPPNPTPGPKLDPDLPFDVSVAGQPPPTLDSLQLDFDRFSWDTFVALNWPPAANGEPDKGKVIGASGDNPTVWQTYKEFTGIFLPGGAKPSAWGAPRTPTDLPQACRDKIEPDTRFLQMISKTPTLREAPSQPFKTGPLIDQNGRYVHFEILTNRVMFDYIVDHTLYSQAGQTASKSNIVFPCGSAKDKKHGAIMIKAAWKILSPTEIESGRFHTSSAIIYAAALKKPSIPEWCKREKVGLVGLHVVTKTKDAPQWIWSTFEQIDNCPTYREPIDKPAYNFYAKGAADLKPNEPALRPWNPSVIEPPARRTQVVRMIPITPATRALNARYQAALKAASPTGNSVWQYYELISTQWPTNPSKKCDVLEGAPVDLIGTPAPQFLGNSTLETYIPGFPPKDPGRNGKDPIEVPNVSSSCMECHANATTTTAKFSDFTFLLERAK